MVSLERYVEPARDASSAARDQARQITNLMRMRKALEEAQRKPVKQSTPRLHSITWKRHACSLHEFECKKRRRFVLRLLDDGATLKPRGLKLEITWP